MSRDSGSARAAAREGWPAGPSRARRLHRRSGTLLEAAHGGTLVLVEIGELQIPYRTCVRKIELLRI